MALGTRRYLFSYFISCVVTALFVPMLPHCRGFTVTLRYTTLSRAPLGGGIGPSQKPLSLNTQHSQAADIHDDGGIRTRSPSKQAVSGARLRPRGHRDRPVSVFCTSLFM